MIMKKQTSNKVALVTLTLGLLYACGDSDISEIQRRELDSVQRATQVNLDAEAELETNVEANSEAEVDSEVDANSDTETAPEVAAASPGVDTSEMELIFSDDFNGSVIDSARWNTSQTWGPDLIINNELQYYVDTQSNADSGFNPFSFDGESLIISAIETPENLQAVANDQPYLSGVLTTAGKFDMTFGYIEARMDFPAGTGLWPAFWMLSSEFEDLKPQLFIAEVDGGKPSSIFHNYNYHDADGNLRSPGQWQVTHEDFAEGFHTLGVSWKAEELLFYIDGEARYRIVGESVSNQAMYLIANLAVGGIWTGAPDSTTTFPAELKIDYIRAYRYIDM